MTYSIQFRHLRALIFDQGDVEILRTYTVPVYGWVNLLLSSVLMALPLTAEEIIETPMTALRALGVLVAAIALAYLVARALGSGSPFNKFVYTIATVNLFGAVVVAGLTYLSLFVFELLLDMAAVSNLIASILPFYLFVLFGFSVDGAANLSDKKGAVLGAVSICALYILYFFFV